MIVSVWPHLGERVIGLSSNHPDNGDGNTIGHHSFFICFQEIDPDDPGPEPEPEPDPEPPGVIVGEVRVTINQAWVAGLQPDMDGNVTFIAKVGE